MNLLCYEKELSLNMTSREKKLFLFSNAFHSVCCYAMNESLCCNDIICPFHNKRHFCHIKTNFLFNPLFCKNTETNCKSVHSILTVHISFRRDTGYLPAWNSSPLPKWWIWIQILWIHWDILWYVWDSWVRSQICCWRHSCCDLPVDWIGTGTSFAD